MILTTDDLHFSYREGSAVLRGVTVALEGGELLFLLGANGAGKTTLLRCLAGLLHPERGTVSLDGQELRLLSPRDRAQKLALVPQAHTPVFSYSTRAMVMMGRAPHLRRLAGPSRRDHQVTEWALRQVGLGKLGQRPYTELSGGEQRLALVARGLAQGAHILLMDEPDANLDPAHQHGVLHLAARLAREGLAVGATSHNPNNALAYGHRAGLLASGTLVSGPPEDVLTALSLEQAYGVPFDTLRDADGRLAVIPTCKPDPPAA